MNALRSLSGIELWQLAGWTMVHFLWLGAIVAIAAAASRFLLRRAQPNIRYAFMLAWLVVLAALPLIAAVWLYQNSPPPNARAGRTVIDLTTSTTLQSPSPIIELHQPELDDVQATALPATTLPPTPLASNASELTPLSENLSPQASTSLPAEPSPSESAQVARNSPGRGEAALNAATTSSPTTLWPSTLDSRLSTLSSLNSLIPYLPWLWLIGTPITFALLLTGVVGTRRLNHASRPLTEGPIPALLSQLAESLRITQLVTVAICDRIAAPVLIGILRPVILLPPAALTGWSPDEIEMVLLHELAHVRRSDNIINLLQRLLESLLFFHPAVWLISSWVRSEREACCDALVVRRTNRPHAYAEMLVALAAQIPRSVLFHPAASSAMAAGPLRSRIRRILQLEDDPMLVSGKSLTLVVGALAVAATLGVLYAPSVGKADEKQSKSAKPLGSEMVDDVFGGSEGASDRPLANPFAPEPSFDAQPQQASSAQAALEKAWDKWGLKLQLATTDEIAAAKAKGKLKLVAVGGSLPKNAPQPLILETIDPIVMRDIDDIQNTPAIQEFSTATLSSPAGEVKIVFQRSPREQASVLKVVAKPLPELRLESLDDTHGKDKAPVSSSIVPDVGSLFAISETNPLETKSYTIDAVHPGTLRTVLKSLRQGPAQPFEFEVSEDLKTVEITAAKDALTSFFPGIISAFNQGVIGPSREFAAARARNSENSAGAESYPNQAATPAPKQPLPPVPPTSDLLAEALSKNNLKAISLATLNYEAATRSLPAHAIYSADGKPLLSWRVALLPYLGPEEQELYKQFHLNEPWDSEHNRKLVARIPILYVIPKVGLPDVYAGKTNYLAVVGPECAFDGTATGRDVRHITDGTANTLAFVEANVDQAVEWTKPADWEFDRHVPARGLGTVWTGHWNGAFVDGSQQQFSDRTPGDSVGILFTCAGGEVSSLAESAIHFTNKPAGLEGAVAPTVEPASAGGAPATGALTVAPIGAHVSAPGAEPIGAPVAAPIGVEAGAMPAGAPPSFGYPPGTFLFRLQKDATGSPVLHLNGEKISDDQVKGKLPQHQAQLEACTVSLSADKGIAYKDLMRVIDLLQSLGVTKMVLDTSAPESGYATSGSAAPQPGVAPPAGEPASAGAASTSTTPTDPNQPIDQSRYSATGMPSGAGMMGMGPGAAGMEMGMKAQAEPAAALADDWPKGVVFPSPKEGTIATEAWHRLKIKVVPSNKQEQAQKYSSGLKVIAGVDPPPGAKNPVFLMVVDDHPARTFDELAGALAAIKNEKLIIAKCVTSADSGPLWIDVAIDASTNPPRVNQRESVVHPTTPGGAEPAAAGMAPQPQPEKTVFATFGPDSKGPEIANAIENAYRLNLAVEVKQGDKGISLITSPIPTEKDWPGVLGESPRKDRVIAEKAWQRLGLKLVPLSSSEAMLREQLGLVPGVRIVGGNVPKGLPLPSLLTGVKSGSIGSFQDVLTLLEGKTAQSPGPIRCFAIADGKDYMFDASPVAEKEERLGLAVSGSKASEALGPVAAPAPTTANPAEIKVLRERVSFVEGQFARVEALWKRGERGGSADKYYSIGYELALAEGELALAEGKRDAAIEKFQLARSRAEEASKASQAAYSSSRITYDTLLSATRNVADIKLKLIRLQGSAYTEASAAPPTQKVASTVPLVQLFFLSSSTSAPSREMAPIVQDAVEGLTSVHLASIDVDEKPDIAKELNVSSVPTFILRRNRKEVARLVGVQTKEQLRAAIKSAQDASGALSTKEGSSAEGESPAESGWASDPNTLPQSQPTPAIAPAPARSPFQVLPDAPAVNLFDPNTPSPISAPTTTAPPAKLYSAPPLGPAAAIAPSSAAGNEELEVLRERVKVIEEQYKMVESLYNSKTKGGTVDRLKSAAYELALAEGELALAEGDSVRAVEKFQQARTNAEEALAAIRANYKSGHITQDVVLQAIRDVAEIKLKLIRLQAKPATPTESRSAANYNPPTPPSAQEPLPGAAPLAEEYREPFREPTPSNAPTPARSPFQVLPTAPALNPVDPNTSSSYNAPALNSPPTSPYGMPSADATPFAIPPTLAPTPANPYAMPPLATPNALADAQPTQLLPVQGSPTNKPSPLGAPNEPSAVLAPPILLPQSAPAAPTVAEPTPPPVSTPPLANEESQADEALTKQPYFLQLIYTGDGEQSKIVEQFQKEIAPKLREKYPIGIAYVGPPASADFKTPDGRKFEVLPGYVLYHNGKVAAKLRGAPSFASLDNEIKRVTADAIAKNKADALSAVSNLRYDGKTFDQWRDLWQTELSTDKRREAIKALAAFGRAGYGKEATETILDVASEYDFSIIEGTDASDGALKDAVLEALTPQYRPAKLAEFWVPEITARAKQDPKKWHWLSVWLFDRLYTNDPKIRAELQSIAASGPTDLRQLALNALVVSDRITKPGANVERQTRDLIDASLESKDSDRIRSTLSLLLYNANSMGGGGMASADKTELLARPALLPLLFNSDESIRQQARGVLSNISEQDSADAIKYLLGVLNDKSRERDHLEAVRALAAVGRGGRLHMEELNAASELQKICKDPKSDKEMFVAALIGLDYVYIAGLNQLALDTSNRQKLHREPLAKLFGGASEDELQAIEKRITDLGDKFATAIEVESTNISNRPNSNATSAGGGMF